ncbi:hypothetical protein T12_15729 [Trichinella patagoniensis]|uniref:Uncharacterized protein n=1 Tax=Trichinella patagoniensis TaxID=990121 RepID=A0A0V0ZJN5_9BILA|nr:hypothetical protein T12_15729 [Trichinella patagoniensis]
MREFIDILVKSRNVGLNLHLRSSGSSDDIIVRFSSWGGFYLRKWSSNRPGLLDALVRGEVSKTEGTELRKTLGVYCVKSEDTLTFISSTGFLTQGLTTRNPGSPYPVNQVRRIELHIFSDASQAAYAACAYLREVTCWSNSIVALTWIKGASRWKPFVAKRVQEIQELVSPHSWRYCLTQRKTQWTFPIDDVVARLGGGLAVARQGKLTQRTAGQIEYGIEQVISPTRYSCYEFYAISHETAESREIQVKEFGVKPNTAERVKEFVPFLDQDGFLRMCGQLRRSTLPPEFKHPVLQHNQLVLEMLIKNHHVRQMHASDNQTLVAIRTRVDAKPYQLKMGDSKLKMANRVTESAPFNQTGVVLVADAMVSTIFNRNLMVKYRLTRRSLVRPKRKWTV